MNEILGDNPNLFQISDIAIDDRAVYARYG